MEQNRDRRMTDIVGRNRRERERRKKRRYKVIQRPHTEVAEHVGTVQYAVVIDKKVGLHTAAVLMLEEETVVEHSNRNSHRRSMKHEACIVENMLSHRLIEMNSQRNDMHTKH